MQKKMSSRSNRASVYVTDTSDITFRNDVSLEELEKHAISLYIDDNQTVTLGSSIEKPSRASIINLSGIDMKRRNSILNDFKTLQDLNSRHLLKHKEWYFDNESNILYVTYEKNVDIPLRKYMEKKAKEHGTISERDIFIVIVQLLAMTRYLSSLKLTNPEWVRYIFNPDHIHISPMGILTFDHAACFEKALAKTINEKVYEFLAPEFVIEPGSSSMRAYNFDNTAIRSSENIYDKSTQKDNNMVFAQDNVIQTYDIQGGDSLLPGWERMQSFDERSLVWSIGCLVLNMCIYNRPEIQCTTSYNKGLQSSSTVNQQLKVDGITSDEFIPSMVAVSLMDVDVSAQMNAETENDRNEIAAFLRQRIEDGKRINCLAKTRYMELDNSVPTEVCAIFDQYDLHNIFSAFLVDFIGRALKVNIEVRPLISTLISEEALFNVLADIAQFLEYRDSHGNTPLHLACAYGCDSFICDKRNILVYAKIGNDNNQSGSMIAAYMGHSECLRETIKYEYGCRDGCGRTALMLAASRGHVECVHQCIMEVKQVDNDNKTALIYAVENGHWEVVDILAPFESGRRPDSGEPAICIAARKGYARSLRTLLDTEQEFLPEVLHIITSHPAALSLKGLSDEGVVESASGNIIKNTTSPYYGESFFKPECCKFIEFNQDDTDEERAKKIRGLFLIVKTHCRKVKLMHYWETEEEFVEKVLTGQDLKYSVANSNQNLSEISSMYISF